MDEDHKLDHLINNFIQFLADNMEHNTDTIDIKVLSIGWALLLVQY